MTSAEFYVSSDALVHLQVSTEYLIARAAEQLAGCLAQQAKVKQSRSKYNRQATPARRVKMYLKDDITVSNRVNLVNPVVQPTTLQRTVCMIFNAR